MHVHVRQPRALRWLLAVAGLLAWQLVAAGPATAIPGQLDPGFGRDGKVTTDFAGHAGASAVVVQDGKLVAAGSATSGTGVDVALARYRRDGTLDPTFGIGGKVTTDIAGAFDEARALVVQDGRLVVAGFTFTGEFSSGNFALARYRHDGDLDPTFGTGGKVVTDFAGSFDEADALVVQGGTLVAGGTAFTGSTSDFALARYRQNGTLDPTFGTGGKATTDFAGGEDRAEALVVQGGKLVAAGSTITGSGRQRFALVRYSGS